MNLYKKILALLVLPLIILSMSSCDEVEAPYAEDGGTAPVDTTKVVKKVLLDEFTGIRCVSCPKAHEIAHEIIEEHKENVVVIAVHSGFFAIPQSPGQYDFQTADGDSWTALYGASGASLPKGMVNRKGKNDNTNVLDREEWRAAVAEAFTEKATIDLKMTADYEASSRKITVKVDYEYLDEAADKFHNLIVCVTEDNIISYQEGAEGDNENYSHQHAFRGCLNGTWGELLTEGISSKEINYTIPTDSDWNPANLNIIAIIQDTEETDDTYEVLQVEQVKLVK